MVIFGRHTMMHQDHVTKFVILNALTEKTSEAGAPVQHTIDYVTELHSLWPHSAGLCRVWSLPGLVWGQWAGTSSELRDSTLPNNVPSAQAYAAALPRSWMTSPTPRAACRCD